MPLKSISIKVRHAKALSVVVGKDDPRSYIRGILIDATSPKGVFLVSSDGHRMAIINASMDGCPMPPQPFHVSVPVDVLALLSKGRKPDDEIRIAQRRGSWVADSNGTRVAFENLDEGGDLCKLWRKVIPDNQSGKQSQIDYEYVASFAKIAKALKRKDETTPNVLLSYNGGHASVVQLGRHPEFMGVVMPMMGELMKQPILDWALDEKRKS